MVKRLAKQFMMHNLKVVRKKDDIKADMDKVKKNVEKQLAELGFRIPFPGTKIQNYGYMPDDDSIDDHRYWVIYSLNQTSAKEMQSQKAGITGRMKTWNEKKMKGDRIKYFKLKEYRGIEYEAIRDTMQNASKILKRRLGSSSDGCDVRVRHQEIWMLFDRKLNEKISLKTLIADHSDIFEKSIKKLSEEARRSIAQTVKKIRKELEKEKETLAVTMDVFQNPLSEESSKTPAPIPDSPDMPPNNVEVSPGGTVSDVFRTPSTTK